MPDVASKKNVVILDANFILSPIQFKIHILEEISYLLEGEVKFIVYKQVINELKAKKLRLEKKSDAKFQNQLFAGLKYLKHHENSYNIIYCNEIKMQNETTDTFILNKALELKNAEMTVFLATNDSELRKRAKMRDIATIFLRQKKFLSID